MARHNNNSSNEEGKITCLHCKTKFPVKLGNKDNPWNRKVRCPSCGKENNFRVDVNGKLHGPVKVKKRRKRD